MQESDERLAQLNVAFERHAGKIAAANTQALEAVIQEFTTRVQTTAGLPIQSYRQQLSSLLSNTIEAANRDPGSHLRRAAEDPGKHVVAVDRALGDELTRSIESFGRPLTVLSRKFVCGGRDIA